MEIFHNIKNQPVNFENVNAGNFNDLFKNVKINNDKIKKKVISDEAKDLINLLLKKSPEKRIESNRILYHPFFENFKFEDYENKILDSPLNNLIAKMNIGNFSNNDYFQSKVFFKIFYFF